MKELRNNLYNRIENLENKLRKFDTNQYGVSTDPEALKIGEEINNLEVQISKTWRR